MYDIQKAVCQNVKNSCLWERIKNDFNFLQLVHILYIVLKYSTLESYYF